MHCFPKNQFTFKLCSVHCCSKQEFCSVIQCCVDDVLVSNKAIAFSLAKCQSHNCKWGICLKTWFQLVSACAWLCLCTLSTWCFKAPARNNTNSIHQTIVKRFHTSEGTSNGRGGPFCSTTGAVKLILTSWGRFWCAGAISCIGWTRPFGHWKGMQNIMQGTTRRECEAEIQRLLCGRADWAEGFSVWQRLQIHTPSSPLCSVIPRSWQGIWTVSRPRENHPFHAHKCVLSVHCQSASNSLAPFLTHTYTHYHTHHSIQPKHPWGRASGCWKCQTALSRPI